MVSSFALLVVGVLAAEPLLAQTQPAAPSPPATAAGASPVVTEPSPDTDTETDADLDNGEEGAPQEHPAGMRAGFMLGAAAVNGSPLRDVLQDGNLSEQTIFLDLQHGPFGLRLEVNTQENTNHTAHIESDYESFALRAASTYFVWPEESRFNLLLFGGGFLAWHEVYLADGMQRWSDGSFGPGAYGGFEVPVRLASKFFLSVRGTVSTQRVHFSRFNSEHNLTERSLLIGGGCAF